MSREDIELLTEGRYLAGVKIIHNGQEIDLNEVPEIRNQILNPNIMNLTDAEDDINRVIDLVAKPKEEAIARKEEKLAVRKDLSGYIVKKIASVIW